MDTNEYGECIACCDIGWLISIRDDGIHAIEACDMCATVGDDTHAAALACSLLDTAITARRIMSRKETPEFTRKHGGKK